MIQIEETVELRRGADEVFLFLADFRNLPRWDPGIAEASLDGGSLAEGAMFSVVARFFGRRVPMRYRMVRFDAASRVAELRGEADGVFATDRIQVSGDGARASVRWQADFELRGPLRWVEPLTGGLFSRLGRKAMDGMRATLDAPGGRSPRE